MKLMHTVVATVCGYEAVAIASNGKIPTITVLDKRAKHMIAPVILGGLAVHFYVEETRRMLDELIHTTD